MQARVSETLVADRYERGEMVARGAMGSVYRATDVTTGQTVALKVLDVPDGETVHRFGREVRALRVVDHPSVVGYLDHGTTTRGAPFLVMEWIEGPTLEAHLAGGVLPIDEVVALGRELGDALAAIHARGVVHRDVKPSNLMLVEGATPRLRLLDPI